MPEGGAPDAEHRAAQRTVVLAATALAAAVVGVLVMLLVDRDGGDRRPVGLVPEQAGGDGGRVAAIGPRVGVEVAAYVAERRRALEAAEGPRLAVVSFVAYLEEDAARAVLAGGEQGGIEVVALVAALPAGAAEVVEGPLADWRTEAAAEASAEREEIARLLPTVDPSDPFRAFYEAELDRLAALAGAAEQEAAVVHGAVVRADADDLRRLAGQAEVRLVDVGTGDQPLPEVTYRALLPEETDVTGTPDLRL